MLFKKTLSPAARSGDFSYLAPDEYYFDSACQTLRPQPVLDAMMEYYTRYNACGGRVKYAWGRRVDEAVAKVREQAVRFVGKHPREYAAVFTLNTTYGINLLLQQLPAEEFTKIFTGAWEHNSVTVPAMLWKQHNYKDGEILALQADGTIPFDKYTFTGLPLVLMQSTSNIDGREVMNLSAVADEAHKYNGVMIVDAAQTVGHHRELLKGIDFDACVFSGHKMYGPSIGVIVLKRSLIKRLVPRIVGGGTVTDVFLDSVHFTDDETLLEPGLQDWAGIIGLGKAMEWMEKQKDLHSREQQLGKLLYEGLSAIPEITMYTSSPSSTVTFHAEKVDSHRLAMYLSEKHIMVRSGYFCCHSYLKNTRKLPPLLRFSLGAHNTVSEVDFALTTLQQLLKTL